MLRLRGRFELRARALIDGSTKKSPLGVPHYYVQGVRALIFFKEEAQTIVSCEGSEWSYYDARMKHNPTVLA